MRCGTSLQVGGMTLADGVRTAVLKLAGDYEASFKQK